MSSLAYWRVLLKLSGGALMDDGDYCIDPKAIGRKVALPSLSRYVVLP